MKSSGIDFANIRTGLQVPACYRVSLLVSPVVQKQAKQSHQIFLQHTAADK